MFSRAKEPSEPVAPQSSSHSDTLWERLLAPVRSPRTLTVKSAELKTKKADDDFN